MTATHAQTLDALKDTLGDFAKDTRMNVGSLQTITSLTAQQLWGTIAACAIATRNPAVTAAAVHDAAQKLTPEALTAAKTAASLMAMNNVYYRSIHLLNKAEYNTMPARLRMTAIANPGVDKLDFELFCLGVSAIGACGKCIESHEHEVQAKGATRDAVQDCFRIAAILQALAVSLEAQENTAGQLAAVA